MSQEGLKSSPSDREMVLAIKSVETLLGKAILPEGIRYEEVNENWKEISEKYPLRAKVFKEVLKYINSGKKIDKWLLMKWRVDMDVPEGYSTLNKYLLEKDPEGDRSGHSNNHYMYGAMLAELKAMAREQEFKGQHITTPGGYKSTMHYFSVQMLEECYRRLQSSGYEQRRRR